MVAGGSVVVHVIFTIRLTILDHYLENEPYVSEGVWEKIEVETMNVVLVNGEKRK